MSAIANASTSTTFQTTSFTYSTRSLYGGAITVDLPQEYIDASQIRQVPDHQEVFLSSTTLTSIIFEINEYVYPNSSNIAEPARHHFADVIDTHDRLSVSSANDLDITEIKMSKDSVGQFLACVTEGDIVSPRSSRDKATSSKCLQLLLRLKQYSTDICVRINVPDKELSEDKSALAAEQQNAMHILETVIRTLDVKDFDLFGTE